MKERSRYISAAVSTALIRHIWGLVNTNNGTFKVIATDADNTLWKGTVSEDGGAVYSHTPKLSLNSSVSSLTNQ